MRDRLIELIEEASQMWDESPLDSFNEVCADHLLADGWIRPLVKVGQTVWVVDPDYGIAVEGVITYYARSLYTTVSEWIEVKAEFPIFGIMSRLDRLDLCLGKTVFLSREDAEKVLKGGDGE